MARNRNQAKLTTATEVGGYPNIESKAPQFLSSLKWIWLNSRSHPIIASTVAVLIFSGAVMEVVKILPLFWPTATPATTAKAPTTSLSSSQFENSASPLHIRFRDGILGSVHAKISLSLDPMQAPRVLATYGEQKRAIAELKSAVEGAIYKKLETMTLDEVRQNRGEIEDSIIATTRRVQKETGHMINAINILAIDEISR